MTGGSGLRLARKARLRWDRHARATFLLLPEKALRLNGTAAEILRLCDGTRDVEAIVAALLASTGATDRTLVSPDAVNARDRVGVPNVRNPGIDPAKVRAEVGCFLVEMISRGIVEDGDGSAP